VGSGEGLPGLDKDGFIDFRALTAKAVELGPKAFLAAYTAPALLFVDEIGSPPSKAPPGKRPDKATAKVQIVTVGGWDDSAKGEVTRRYLDRVGFLVKRPRTPSPT
jgi:hypothetical protein